MNSESQDRKPIASFRDLIVYQNTYAAMMRVMNEVLTLLPDCEKYDLRDQLSRACKSIPRLIGEGYAKRHQKAGFRKYIDDAMAECNEMMVSLWQARDLYDIEANLINSLAEVYEVSGKQLFVLGEKWKTFDRR